MTITDIHSHTSGPSAVVSIEPHDIVPDNGYFSIGIHPWHIGEDWENDFQHVSSKASCSRCFAVGECGLDHLSAVSMELQTIVFRAHLRLAFTLHKPVVVHCVKAFAELVAECRMLGSECPSIIVHGFRGKPEQARQLLAEGYSLSFGERFNSESVRLCPPCRLFAETDESAISISDVILHIADARSESIDAVEKTIAGNAMHFHPF